MYSFGIIERYLILAEFPLIVDPLRLRFSGRPFMTSRSSSSKAFT